MINDVINAVKNNCTLKKLIKLHEAGADIHYENDNALRWASFYGRLDLVKYLVENDADVNAVEDEALQYASSNGHIEVVKYLVEHGANIKASIGIDEANSYGHDDVFNYLKDQIRKEKLSKLLED